jgi:hypothetical protein
MNENNELNGIGRMICVCKTSTDEDDEKDLGLN